MKKGALAAGNINKEEFEGDVEEASKECGGNISVDAENDRLVFRVAKEKRKETREMLIELLEFYKLLG